MNIKSDVTPDEFREMMFTFFSKYEPGIITIQMDKEWTFMFGGKARDKEEMLSILTTLENTIKGMPDET